MLALRKFSAFRRPLTNYFFINCVLKYKNSKDASDFSEEQKNSDPKKDEPIEKNEKYVYSSKKYLKAESKMKSVKKTERSDIFAKTFKSTVDNVAEHFGGNTKQTKEELLNYLQAFSVSRGKSRNNIYFSSLSGKKDNALMKIFYNVKDLNIFKEKDLDSLTNDVLLNIWNKLEEEELQQQSKTHPSNHFEELINWTEEGKLWHFPINNDQGLNEEAKVSFTEHIFLENHLEPWCPKKGPLRKFMELVLVGLAKNPYLSVEEKKEHIDWFENYFENKKKLLQELGAIGTVKGIDSSVKKTS